MEVVQVLAEVAGAVATNPGLVLVAAVSAQNAATRYRIRLPSVV